MLKKKLVASASALALLGIFAAEGNNVGAATKAVTPSLAYRYKKNTAYYFDLSTSDYYKDVWNSATAAWRKNGFTWKKAANHSKTTVSSYSDETSSGLKVAGYDSVDYDLKTGKIISSKVRLNRAVFKKYGYTKAERINVAEHELGHALGLDHNSADSVSVMNPANRYYSIKPCDVKGMKKIYSTAASFDLVDGQEEIVTVINYIPAVAKIRNVKTKYVAKSKALSITGQAKGAKSVKISYNGKAVKNAKVDKKGKFKASVKFAGYKNFTLIAKDKKGKALTKAYTITSDKYATSKPVAVKASHPKKAAKLTYTVNAAKGSKLNFYYKNKLVKSVRADKKQLAVTFSDKELVGKKGNFTVTAKSKNKKTSPKAKFSIVSAGHEEVLNY